MPATPERVLEALEAKREPRRDGKRVIFDEEISVKTLSLERRRGLLGRRCLSASPSDLERPSTSFEFVDGVRLHAIGGDQVLMCRVQYEPGKQVPWHAHEHTEQVMAVVEGSVEMTIGDETRDARPRRRRRRQPRASSTSSTPRTA